MNPLQIVRGSLLLIAGSLLLVGGCGTTDTEEEVAPAEPARHVQKLRPPLEYQAVEGTQGLLRQATLYSQNVPSLAATLEVLSILVPPRESVLPTDRETLLEVLTGDVLNPFEVRGQSAMLILLVWSHRVLWLSSSQAQLGHTCRWHS